MRARIGSGKEDWRRPLPRPSARTLPDAIVLRRGLLEPHLFAGTTVCGLIGSDVRLDWPPQMKKDLISGRDSTQCDNVRFGVEFIKALPGQWKGSSDPNAPSETVDTMAEEEPVADSVAVRPESDK